MLQLPDLILCGIFRQRRSWCTDIAKLAGFFKLLVDGVADAPDTTFPQDVWWKTILLQDVSW